MSGQAGPSRFEVKDVVSDGVHTLVLSGELDLVPAADLEAMILRLCAEGTSGIGLDLRKLTFMDSTGLRLILSTRDLCAEHGYDFFLVPGPKSVQRVFEITGLLDAMPFRNDPFDQAGDADELEQV
jgi:anti-anti-sigma factor